MIGAGIFVLTGIAAGEAGPAALLSFALNAFVTLLTALSYAELASSYPKSGGGYSYISKAFPGPAGFATHEAMETHFQTRDFEVLVGAAGVLGKAFKMMITEVLAKGGADLAKSKIAGGR